MIQYIVPEYVTYRGDCCIVSESDNELLYYRKITPVIRELYRDRALDPLAIKKKLTDTLDQRNLIPLCYSIIELLIPFKVRIALVHNDALYGYVNIFSIKEIKDKRCFVLDNGKELYFMDEPRIIRKRIKMAQCIYFNYKSLFPYLYSNITEEFVYSHLNLIYPVKNIFYSSYKK